MLQPAPRNATPGVINGWLELSYKNLEDYGVPESLWLSILCSYAPDLDIPASGDVGELIAKFREKKSRHESNAILDIVLDNSERAIRAQKTTDHMMRQLERRIIDSPDGDFYEYMSKRFLLINQLTTNERQRQVLLLDGIRGAAREHLLKEFPSMGQWNPPQIKARILAWADKRNPPRQLPLKRPDPPATARIESNKRADTRDTRRPSTGRPPRVRGGRGRAGRQRSTNRRER